ncbi:MAG TPA: MotA/TolQ/ExbB proton channel family protein [Polyangiaceae bacterium]|nr:MotA/TolQ/ExbB proton channel family protein [Polyangiaceae bacterium]
MAGDRKTVFARIMDSSWVLGAVATVTFYTIVLQPSMRGTLIHRYTAEHAVDFVIVALFMWGLFDVALKLLSFPAEVLALRQHWLPARKGREPATQAAVLLEQIRARSRWLRESRAGKRLALALEYVVENASADEYREHLQYLADQDLDVTHSNYTLVRFVVGVSPVLGFLGTVVHFGTALSGISFDEMAERLPVVVGEMGQAFNTTTVALAAAMSMMFCLFLCERTERGIVRSIDRLVERELLNRFEVKDANIVPFLSVIRSANEEALQAIAATLQRQIEVWTRALDSVFRRFDERQQQELRGWQGALEVLQKRHEAYDAAQEERLRQWLSAVESRQDKHLAGVQATLEKVIAFRSDFAGFVKTLDTIARGEGKLVELQALLADNLRVLHETQKIDDALHGLTGAIHLLTARRHLTVAPDAAAA